MGLVESYGGKESNDGRTSRGRLSSEEWNSFVAEVSRQILANASGLSLLRSELSSLGEVVSGLEGGGGSSVLAGSKVGYMTYEGGSIVYYDEEGGTRLGSVALTGTVYSVQLSSDVGSVFYVLTSSEASYIRVTPTTKSGTIGSSLSDYVEDYTWTLSVSDAGGAFREVKTGRCESGGVIGTDVRSWLRVGENRLRVSVTGVESGQTKTMILTCHLTTLTLSCSYQWWKAFVEGESYGIDGIYFGGNMQKTLHVVVDDDPGQSYVQQFSAGTSYTTAGYTVDMSRRFPAGGTGVHKVELWLSGDGVETPHYVYRMMCVSRGEEQSSRLVCVNSVASEAVNYASGVLFEYATYNATEVEVGAVLTDGNSEWSVVSGQRLTVETQSRQQFTTSLEVDTAVRDGLRLDVTVCTVGSGAATREEVSIAVDNSNAYMAADGATFYMNAATRSNGDNNRETIVNGASGSVDAGYAGVWSGFAWSGDGWSVDDVGRRCLSVMAGSELRIPDLRPLSSAQTRSVSIELLLKVNNVADYETPLVTIMSTPSYEGSETTGLIVRPTKATVLTSTEREEVLQSVQLSEGRVTHLVVVLQRNYGRSGRNLCQLYVDGKANCVFEYAGNASFGSGCVVMGQQSSDLYVYALRVYGTRALERGDVFGNWLNMMADGAEYVRSGVKKDNNILDGGEVSYELCRGAGYNCMVVETAGDVSIPSIEHTTGCQSTLRLEYNDHPEWDVTIENAPMDGQGTTSMRYYRWNLRWKLKDAATWTYADGTTSTKSGYLAGKGRPKVNKITAKKNYASSPQGHKMGATSLYDDLYGELGLKSGLPSEDCRVAVYQYPFIGFQKFADGSYRFIGLYTLGPDKGDKKTFGYDEERYPRLLSLEGPNHAPLGSRFLHPWTSDVVYDAADETLKFGGEEGWDVDAAPWDSDDVSHATDIDVLLREEWKPCYDLAYFCSPYLRSLDEIGLTLEELNGQVSSWRMGTDQLGSRRNEVLTLYDRDYNLIYYRTSSGRYEVLEGYDMLEWLDGYLPSSSPDTSELILARAAKFRAEAGNYISVDDACYHDNFCELIGAKDNHTKNSYPFKFKPLSEGGRWCWRQDDLDSILATDNNGQNTSSYSIEVGDVTGDGTDIFQGSSSAFWTLVRGVFAEEKRQMMVRMVNGLVSMSQRFGIVGRYVHESVFNVLGEYFWSHSALYFPAVAYNEDAVWSYYTPWLSDGLRTYNNVYPLTQALGDQLQAERQWLRLRIAYLFSQYRLGGFTGSGDDGYGRLEFTPAETFTFKVRPAIDLYPSGNRGGGDDIQGARTRAGDVCDVRATSDGSTTYYLKALDWLASLGDLSGLVLTNRGGDASVGAAFSVSSRRLRELKVGDADASKVRFNAGSLSVSGAAIEVIDARNVTTLRSNVSLLGCPRLRRALFGGSSAPTLLIPRGARVTEVEFPDLLQTLFLHTLPLLSDAGLTLPAAALGSITGIYFNNCPQLSPFGLLRRVWQAENSKLQFVTLIWQGDVSGTSADLDLLAALATGGYDAVTGEGYGSVSYDADTNQLEASEGRAHIEGRITVAGNAYEDSVVSLRDYFGSLVIEVNGQFYVRFEDEAVAAICSTYFGDGTGTTRAQMAAAARATKSASSWDSAFEGHTEIRYFDEFRYFTGIVSTASQSNGQYTNAKRLFQNCSKLERVSMPAVSLQYRSAYLSPFQGCTSLVRVTWGNCEIDTTAQLYQGCKALEYYEGIIPRDVTTMGSNMFNGCTSLTRMIFPEGVTETESSIFYGCSQIRYVEFPSTMTVMDNRQLFFNVNTNDIVVVMKAAVPPTVSRSDYMLPSGRTYKLYVPDGSVGAYKADSSWSNQWTANGNNIYGMSELGLL